MTRTPSDADLGELAHLATALRSWSPDISPDRFAGRGIVVAAGGSTVFTNAFVLIDVLRNTLGCRLPIEVWHLGAAEMSPAMANLLHTLGASVVDAEPLIRQHGATVRDGWQLKPFAMLWSSFAEVLLLDADQVPVSDPAQCFDWPEYRQSGAIFWPDIIDLLEANPVWAALGLPARRAQSMESGQILVDKRRHLRPLAITGRLNEAADLLYEIIYGDKDSFLLGWELAGASFTMVPHRPFRDDSMLLQRDFSGQPLFQHRTGAKWRYDGEQTKLGTFVHEEACLAALDRLVGHWGGAVFHQPDRTAAARQTEAELIAAGVMSLEIGGDERLQFELLPYGEIGLGRASDRRNWWCREENGRLVLNLALPGWIEIHSRAGINRVELVLPTDELIAAAVPAPGPGGALARILPPAHNILHCLTHHHIGHRGDYSDEIDFKGLYEFAADIETLDEPGRAALLAAAARHPRLMAALDLWLVAAAYVFRLTVRSPLRRAPDAQRHWSSMVGRIVERARIKRSPRRFEGLRHEMALTMSPARLRQVAGGGSLIGRLALRGHIIRALVAPFAAGAE